MDINVLDIKGQETGRKVTLNENIFGIEPNDHVLYLDVKQYLADQRQGTAKSKERSEHAGSTRKLDAKRVAVVHAVVILTHLYSLVVVVFSVQHHAIIVSNSTRK